MNLFTIFLVKNRFQIVLLFVMVNVTIYAQNNKQFLRLNGMISLSYDNYSSNVKNYNLFRNRYPADLFRLNANATLYFGKYFSIPFGINFSNQEKTFNLPTLPEEGVYNYIRNPRNNFHFDPTYKWIHTTFGSHTPQYSEFTSGDMQIFGMGVDINPGKFIFSANYGTSQYAVEPNPSLRIPGAYEQKIMGARIGIGKLKGSKFTLNLVKVSDDVHSLKQNPIGIKPKEGISFAPMLEVDFTKNIKLKSEFAASVFTEDLLAKNSLGNEFDFDKISKIITINNSSHLDYAHINNISWHSKNIGVGVEVKYIGPGFMSVGYRNIEKDIIDYKLLTDFKLFKNKFILNGSVGLRTNNISGTKLDKNKRVIGNVNLLAQFTKKFSLNFSYSNFGFRNNRKENMYRIEMVSNSFSLTPTYQIANKNRMQQLSLTTSFDQFTQYDAYTQSFLETTSKMLQTNYLISFNKSSFHFALFALYMENSSDLLSIKMENAGLNLGYYFFKKKLKTNLYTTFTRMERPGFTPDDRLNFRLKMRYKLAKKTDFDISFSQYNNRYGSYRPGAEIQENKLQVMLTQKF